MDVTLGWLERAGLVTSTREPALEDRGPGDSRRSSRSWGLVLGTSAGVLLYRALAAHPVTPLGVGVGLGRVGLSVVIGTGLLTAVPARLEARRSVADVLRD